MALNGNLLFKANHERTLVSWLLVGVVAMVIVVIGQQSDIEVVVVLYWFQVLRYGEASWPLCLKPVTMKVPLFFRGKYSY